MSTAIAIPARIGSSRLPGKVLKDINGKTMIERVVDQCLQTGIKTYVVTDSLEVYDLLINKVEVLKSSSDCESGTERIASVVGLIDEDYVINVQGDQPFIEPEAISEMMEYLESHNEKIVTPVTDIQHKDYRFLPDRVKVVISNTGKALYFSRSPIPFNGPWLTHIGIYGYHRSVLENFSSLDPSSNQKSESLEQLKFLDNDIPIQTYWTNYEHFSVDNAVDLQNAIKYAREHC